MVLITGAAQVALVSNPIQIRIRGTQRVRDIWTDAQGKFDMTYAELAINLCRFAMENPDQFKRFSQGESRTK